MCVRAHTHMHTMSHAHAVTHAVTRTVRRTLTQPHTTQDRANMLKAALETIRDGASGNPEISKQFVSLRGKVSAVGRSHARKRRGARPACTHHTHTHTPHPRANKHTRTHTPRQVRANAVMRREEDRVTTGEKAFVDALERHNLQAFDKTLSPSTLAATSDVPAQVPARV